MNNVFSKYDLLVTDDADTRYYILISKKAYDSVVGEIWEYCFVTKHKTITTSGFFNFSEKFHIHAKCDIDQ